MGALGVRWVLAEHARPWVLTVKAGGARQGAAQGGLRPRWRSSHNIPFMRKRNHREVATTAEAKTEAEPDAEEPLRKRQKGTPAAIGRTTEEGLDSKVVEQQQEEEVVVILSNTEQDANGVDRRWIEGGEEGDISQKEEGKRKEREEEEKKESLSPPPPDTAPSSGGDG